MESIKPVIDQESILVLLADTFHQPVQNLSPLEGGLAAQALSFQVGEQEYVLRFNPGSFDTTFQKEVFIYEHFASPLIPIPPLIRTGKLGNIPYAISLKMPGRGLKSLSRVEYEQINPQLLNTLYAIHTCDVSSWHGYGTIGDDGQGMFPTWKGFIARIMEEERPDGFYGLWHNLFQTTFLERNFFEKVYAHMLHLLEFCPEERWLVHSEYGYDNVLVDNGKVTAVLDWTDAMYGDFVYDIAGMDFWPPEGINFPYLVYQAYTAKGLPLENYWKRLAVYKCYLGLDALRFFAKTNDHNAYLAVRKKLERELG